MRSVLLGGCLLCGVLLGASQDVEAGSIWIYTFSDVVGPWQNEPIGFSFSLPAPLQLAPSGNLAIHGVDLDSCTVPVGDACQFAQMWWQAPGDFRVNFEYGVYPTVPPDDADFQIASLGDEGVYIYQVSGLASFTIHDPVIGPEPGSRLLILLGLGFLLGLLLLTSYPRRWHTRVGCLPKGTARRERFR